MGLGRIEKQMSVKYRIAMVIAVLLAVQIPAQGASLDCPVEWQVSQRNAEGWAEIKVAGSCPANTSPELLT